MKQDKKYTAFAVEVALDVSNVLQRVGAMAKNNLQTKADIHKVLRANVNRIRALKVRRLALFGSFVRGDQREDSDVDVLVEFEEGQKTFDHFIQLVYLLEDLLGRRVELVTPEGLSPYLGPHILEEAEYVSFAS